MSSRHLVVAVLAAVAASLEAAPTASAAPWRWPLEGQVAREFRVGANPYAAGQHRGVDLAAPPGRPVRAACPGPVRFAGRVGDSGLVVSVLCGELIASYLHLSETVVRRGERVGTGRRLGTVGRTGDPSPGPAHLHLGAREVATGRYRDPLELLGGDRTPPGAPVLGGPRRALPRPVPLSRAPARVRVPAPAPGLAPASGLAPAPGLSPVPLFAAPPAGASDGPAPARSLPLVAWLGLVLFAAGVPLGGLVRRRRRARGGGGRWSQLATSAATSRAQPHDRSTPVPPWP